MPKKKVLSAEDIQSSDIYQLKIALCNVSPPVWRRLLVPGVINLGLLHAVIQVAMGWTNSHLHQFIIDGKFYSDPTFGLGKEDGDLEVLNEAKTVLSEVMPRAKGKFFYEYDFGDDWVHQITVEKILPPGSLPMTGVADCIAGKRACPPDDCGGPWGYAEMLKTIKDPEHEEHDDMLEWLGGEFDPKAFDPEETNSYLRMLKGSGVTINQLAKVLLQRDAAKG